MTSNGLEPSRTATPGQTNPKCACRALRRGDAGYDSMDDACIFESGDFFIEPAEHERVAGLEADNTAARTREADHQRIDVGLPVGTSVSLLADVDPIDASWDQGENLGRDELIVKDDVCRLDCTQGLERQELGITRAGSGK